VRNCGDKSYRGRRYNFTVTRVYWCSDTPTASGGAVRAVGCFTKISERTHRALKKVVSKADIRDELLQETQRFLNDGGRVTEIPRGISGREPGDPALFLNRQLFSEPRSTRTPVPEVVAAIEARRLEKYSRKPRRQRRLPQPRRKVIYDDFGEPLRRVWSEE
jgi:SutA RNAP-binding domain